MKFEPTRYADVFQKAYGATTLIVFATPGTEGLSFDDDLSAKPLPLFRERDARRRAGHVVGLSRLGEPDIKGLAIVTEPRVWREIVTLELTGVELAVDEHDTKITGVALVRMPARPDARVIRAVDCSTGEGHEIEAGVAARTLGALRGAPRRRGV